MKMIASLPVNRILDKLSINSAAVMLEKIGHDFKREKYHPRAHREGSLFLMKTERRYDIEKYQAENSLLSREIAASDIELHANRISIDENSDLAHIQDVGVILTDSLKASRCVYGALQESTGRSD